MFKAIWKIFMNIITLGTYKANNAANDVLSGSPDGIRAAYDLAKNELIDRHENIINAVARIQAQKTKSENELKALSTEEIELQNVLEGIIQAVEANPEDVEAVQDFNSMDKRQQEIDARQEELSKEIEQLEADIKEYKLSLNDIADQISALEKESNRSVADMELAKMREQIEAEKAGLQKSVDMSGVAAIREKLAQKKAKVETLKMSNGSNTEDRMRKYKDKATTAASNTKLNDILSKRASAKNAETAGKGSTETISTETEGNRAI